MAFRQPTAGPELDLVLQFCNEHLGPSEAGQSLSVFLEPKLESGFPDVVAVYWEPAISNKWPTHRQNLLPQDMNIVQYVHLAEMLPVDMLVKRFGARRASQLMLRLSDAQIVEVRSDGLYRKPLGETFAIKRLVAIEAKVKDWSKGLEQAFQNTWFASESYLLLGVLPQQSNLAKCAKKLGIGVLHKQHSLNNPYLKSNVGTLPTSYASWLFNEWAWKFADS
jgi:hypothetical protein